MTCVAIKCDNWITASLHQNGASIYVLMEEAIDKTLDFNLYVDLLGLLLSEDAVVDAVRICNTIHLLFLVPGGTYSHLEPSHAVNTRLHKY